ncbi:hypothetical protein Tco_1459622, partial [Tanacetum coccineum]
MHPIVPLMQPLLLLKANNITSVSFSNFVTKYADGSRHRFDLIDGGVTTNNPVFDKVSSPLLDIYSDASADMVDEYRSKEYLSGTYVTEFEESVLHEEYMFVIHLNDEKHQETNMSSLLHTTIEHEMGQVKLEPSEYYFHVMHDFRELPRLAIPASGIVVFRSDTGKYKKFRSECDEFLKLVATRLDLLRKMESLDL